MPLLPNRTHLPGLLLTVAIGLAALSLADVPLLAPLHLSALTLAIVLGMLLGNVASAHVPAVCLPGIGFSQKNLLRLGVVLYGFRISFQQIAGIGWGGLALDLIIVASTVLIGAWLGRRVLGLDRDTALLTACGSAICGAAAVLAAERVIKPTPDKVAIAVATVVLFGTLNIFLYPLLYPYLGLDAYTFGIYAGATVHEVAQVVAVGNAVGPAAADTAVIVKLTRVMLLVPFLLLLSWRTGRGGEARGGLVIPWFALWFMAASVLNSLIAIPALVLSAIQWIDTLLLAIAMGALGLETRFQRLRVLGMKPILLAALLFVWLSVGGYWLTRWLA